MATNPKELVVLAVGYAGGVDPCHLMAMEKIHLTTMTKIHLMAMKTIHLKIHPKKLFALVHRPK